MEEFEGKVDKIAAGQEDNSWISKLYQNYNKTFGGVDEDLKTKQVLRKIFRITFQSQLIAWLLNKV